MSSQNNCNGARHTRHSIKTAERWLYHHIYGAKFKAKKMKIYTQNFADNGVPVFSRPHCGKSSMYKYLQRHSRRTCLFECIFCRLTVSKTSCINGSPNSTRSQSEAVCIPYWYDYVVYLSLIMILIRPIVASDAIWRHRSIWINNGSDDDLLPGGTKPLPEPMLTYHNCIIWHSPESYFTGGSWN